MNDERIRISLNWAEFTLVRHPVYVCLNSVRPMDEIFSVRLAIRRTPLSTQKPQNLELIFNSGSANSKFAPIRAHQRSLPTVTPRVWILDFSLGRQYLLPLGCPTSSVWSKSVGIIKCVTSSKGDNYCRSTPIKPVFSRIRLTVVENETWTDLTPWCRFPRSSGKCSDNKNVYHGRVFEFQRWLQRWICNIYGL